MFVTASCCTMMIGLDSTFRSRMERGESRSCYVDSLNCNFTASLTGMPIGNRSVRGF